MAKEDTSKTSAQKCGWVHHVGWNDTLDAIERHTQRKLDILDEVLDTEVKSICAEAEKIIASLYGEDALKESIEVDKYEALAEAQQKLSEIYRGGPPSKLAVVDELRTMMDDCLELFDFNQSRFEKFSNVPIEGKARSFDFLEVALYTPCLALSMMAFAILLIV